MKLRIKTKLSLGLAFLFTVIVLVGGFGIYYVRDLTNASLEILKDNYESLEYMRTIRETLEQSTLTATAFEKVEHQLKLQESNITEIGEDMATAGLREGFSRLKTNPSDKEAIEDMREKISLINDLNMQAITRKNQDAQKTSERAIIVLSVIGTICFLVTFTFIINFPGYIANPIRELTDSIKEISNKKYETRLFFKSGDEFGELADAFNVMAQKLDEYEHSNLAQFVIEKKRIETLIDKMHDPVIGLDEKNKVLFANREAMKILGLSRDALIGRFAQDISLSNDLMRALTRNLFLSKEEMESTKTQPLKIYADNKESYFQPEIVNIEITPTGEKQNQLIGHVIILSNVTPFKELDLAKTNFIATISHELKTPISSIKMSARLLEDIRIGETNEEQKQLIEHIKEDSERLLKITSELLDLAQVETGNIRLEKQTVEAQSIIDYAYGAMKFQAEQKQIAVEVYIEPGLPKVVCDLEKTVWVMVNLLSNAIRYGLEQSKIIIKVARQGNNIVFSVEDFGRGIHPKYKDKVFEKFFKIPNMESGKTGSGLGLAISKEFIEAQGGKIWMESEIGKGSNFSFSLKAITH